MNQHLKVCLGLYNFRESPSEIASRFSITPDQLRVKGELVGRVKVPAKENGLLLFSKRREEEDLDLHVQDLLERVPPEISGVKDLVVKLLIVVRIRDGDSTPVSAICLEPETVEKLARIKCSLDFDIYGKE